MMAASDQASRIAPYVVRLLEDEYVQEQLTQVATALRKSSRRAKGKSATEAISDRRLTDQLYQSASALSQAVRALREPAAPKRHPLRLAGLLLACGAAGVLVWRTVIQPRSDASEERP